MNNSKNLPEKATQKNTQKTILIMLLPAALTLYFVARVLFPAIQSYCELHDKYQETKKTFMETKASVEELKNNKKLLEETQELNKQVPDFDVQVPSEFQDEFFLVDIGKFSINTATKIISLNTKKETEFKIEIKNPNNNNKKQNNGARKQKVQPVSPLTVYEKPFEIKTLGHYNEVISFIDRLEKYQRKFIINGISAQISQNDEKNLNPRIEITIKGSTFKAVRNLSSSAEAKP